ncbi:MAG: hypothetical protein JNJ73_06385 [Hyphomonadaceae bacterium]|nr:hypothetical protein [Hyphomonadaceae bacterium]
MVAVLKSAFFGAVLAGLALAAAASGTAAAAPDSRQTVQAGDVRFEALPPQELRRGECGLFLWARTNSPMLLMTVIGAEDSVARVRADGSQRTLPRTEFDGSPVHGQFERQVFSDGRLTLEVDVHFDANRQIRDGAIVQSGVVRVVNRAGWKTILPVGGMVACQT